MFYSQWLVLKNGPLAAIWVAGCCFKRLNKHQITRTNIPSSVDKILIDGLDTVTYRILAYLLLGVVRIYSRKVEYLFRDCHDVVSDINRFSVGKRVIPFKDLVRSSHSIVLPERYELDTYQLEAAEGSSSGNITTNERIILPDAREGVFEPCSLREKPLHDYASPHSKENHNSQASTGIGVQQETCSSTQTPDKISANWKSSTDVFTPPDKVLSPHQMDIDKEVSSPDHVKTFQTKTSKEKLLELRFSEEEGMDVDMICGVDMELLNLINEYQTQEHDDRDGDNLEKIDSEKQDKAPNLDIPDNTAGDTVPELLVHTPSKKSIRRPQKRKCIFDEILVLDNQIMKQTINNASDLVCKRRKAPHTVIDIWRFYHIPALSKNFLEPLIPCAALEILDVDSSDKIAKSKPCSSEEAHPLEAIETVSKPQEAGSLKSPRDSRLTMAPRTPVRCPTDGRVFASPMATYSIGEGHVEEHYGPTLMDEMDPDEGDSQELHKNKSGFSARTRSVASYLHHVIHEKKKQGEESASLLHVLEHEKKAENARFFFEILVLTSGGFLKVKQDKAYDDVFLEETTKMEEVVGDRGFI